MRQQVLLDTGPLVAFLKPQDQWHAWVTAELTTIAQPLLTCEAVISEACFLLRRTYAGEETVLSLIADGYLQIPFDLGQEAVAVRRLMSRYHSVPMSLADACLVRMAEQYRGSAILTLDSDFQIYRKDTNQVIPVIMPPV
ncbi:PIN domain-containing protein [Leptolyngbya sp. NK1-12]|uniref:PIN domain-containing protein n=1 Tax=Leptolyngbya sp. NK1-12 TaxID=2547451 RepID=A0AA96WBI2_9CYAN|nr:PIN domain-containing protein [Leptolyngbya sp. NK1-12]